MTGEMIMFQTSVRLCNQRAVLLEEYRHYAQNAAREFESYGEFRQSYFDEHAPKGRFAAASFIIPFLVTFFLLFEKLDKGEVNPVVFFVIVIPAAILLYNLVFKRMYLRKCEGVFSEYLDTVQAYEELRPQIIAARDDAKQRLEQLEARMEDDSVCVIPRSYWHLANHLDALIRNKRATDVVSAINKYEDIQHQNRMEGMAAQSMEIAEMTRLAAEQTAINTQIAAENAKKAAFYSEMHLWHDYLNDK